MKIILIKFLKNKSNSYFDTRDTLWTQFYEPFICKFYFKDIEEIEAKMKFILIENYDYEFYAELYKKGVTVKTINLLKDNNIRRDIMAELSDSDFN